MISFALILMTLPSRVAAARARRGESSTGLEVSSLPQGEIGSTTASIFSPSALASLREPSSIQSREEFFTLRREGAKEASESKHRISSRNLSGLAPLRETSVTQGGRAEEER
jgi:hypothetical protein